MYAAALAWAHLVAATLWVGSQLFLILAVIPALRTIPDHDVQRQVLVALTRRYNVIGWVSLGTLVVTGLLRLGASLPAMSLLLTTWYGQVLLVKVTMVGGIVVLTALHTAFIGPRLLALTPASSEAPSQEYQRLRRVSVAVSTLNLTLSLAILAAAVGLRVAPF